MRTTSLTFACLAAAAATLGACGGPTAPERQLLAARVKWERARPAAYTITVARWCECTQEMSGPVVVSVRDGIVESRTYVASAAAVTPPYADLFPSIDGLFERIDDARRRRAASVDVTYDPVFGFPTVISIDYDRVMVDDELTYRATDFRPR
jgi:uncharacterized protein DUF6174